MNWQATTGLAFALAEKAAGEAARVRGLAPALPKARHAVLVDPEAFETHLGLAKEASDADAAAWRKAGFDPAPLDVPPPGWGERPWVLVKRSADPAVSAAASLANFKPWLGNAIFGGPSPLAATLAGGLLGAGLGYGFGSATDGPDPYGESNRPAVSALLGGLAGAAPGLLWGLTSYKGHPESKGKVRSFASGWPFRRADAPAEPKTAAAALAEVAGVKAAWAGPDVHPFGQGVDMLASLPAINREGFVSDVWNDPHTPMPVRAAVLGLVDTAGAAAGGRAFLSPLDIARVADDARRGLVVGRTFGALYGASPEDKHELQQSGVWAGVLERVVPLAFPEPGRIFR